MSEYLNLLKQRRDATPPPGNAPNVQSNVTFRKAIDYIEKLEAQIVNFENQERYLLERLKFVRAQRNIKRVADHNKISELLSAYYLDCDDNGCMFGITRILQIIADHYEATP